MATISNNLANVSTNGFKRGRAIFEDLLYQNVRQVGAQSSQDTMLPSGLQVGTGARVVATERLFTQGNLVTTDNALDVAIQGRGFFEVLLPDGTQGFTRDGSFHLNDQGLLVSSAGYPLQPPVTIPQDALSITIAQMARYLSSSLAHLRQRKWALFSSLTSLIPQAYRPEAKTFTWRQERWNSLTWQSRTERVRDLTAGLC